MIINRVRTEAEAIRIALEYCGLAAAELRDGTSRREENLYHVALRTPFQRYELYVNALDGEITGIDTEPATAFFM